MIQRFLSESSSDSNDDLEFDKEVKSIFLTIIYTNEIFFFWFKYTVYINSHKHKAN